MGRTFLVLLFLFRLPSVFDPLLLVLFFAPFVGPVYGLFCFLYRVLSLVDFSLYFSVGGVLDEKKNSERL